jgi:glycosyltransferase involved in cell wall biosynthesis
MNLTSPPLVSVLTPVYNGEKYLVDCIESILRQTYKNWEYTIVNNCSTDRTLEIAQNYANENPKIRIHNNQHFLNLVENSNHAFHLISKESKYCKIVHADDWLFPECIEKMVEVAESNPTVGIVSSYRLDEKSVNCDGLPYPSTVISGRKVCRSTILGEYFLYGSPTTVLIRSDIIQSRRSFYNEYGFSHEDTEACYDVLKDFDFGFVHKILSFTRRHNETSTTICKRINSYIFFDIFIHKKYGPIYLSDQEYKELLRMKIKRYYRFLAKSIFQRKGDEFWNYHKRGLRKIGIPLSYIELSKAIFIVVYNKFLNALKIN